MSGFKVVDNNTKIQSRHGKLREACQAARDLANTRRAPMFVLNKNDTEVACFDGNSGELGYSFDPTEGSEEPV